MPYVQEHRRAAAAECPQNVGELNYALTVRAIADLDESFEDLSNALAHIVQQFVDRRGVLTYQTINDVMGALSAAEHEAARRDFEGCGDVFSDVAYAFYQREAGPLEDLKCAVNGDVYPT